MLKKGAKLIHKLRIYFLVFFSVAFLFVLGLSPVDIGKFVGSEWGRAVGLNVGVQENPFNKLALDLKNREAELDARENDLVAREQDLLAPNKRQNVAILIMGVGILLLFVLVITNYYLDFHRKKKVNPNDPN